MGQGIVTQETETGRSNRVVSISETIIQALKHHKVLQQQDRDLFGEVYLNNGFVIALKDGSPLNPNYVHNHCKRVVEFLDLPKIRFHDLQHTHAPIMLRLGEHPKIVSERLGHSSIQMTLNTYSHVTFYMQKESADRFGQAMNSAKHAL
ncbi:tyrosine-type recombinase/integrase [uncultured Brevibacillus sp.]|uniref:tyrosine-type recombinase/integrase n=1 Tax=uncultured Brevibacillus sp. TaxID=169970 RepID=UPI00338F8913